MKLFAKSLDYYPILHQVGTVMITSQLKIFANQNTGQEYLVRLDWFMKCISPLFFSCLRSLLNFGFWIDYSKRFGRSRSVGWYWRIGRRVVQIAKVNKRVGFCFSVLYLHIRILRNNQNITGSVAKYKLPNFTQLYVRNSTFVISYLVSDLKGTHVSFPNCFHETRNLTGWCALPNISFWHTLFKVFPISVLSMHLRNSVDE